MQILIPRAFQRWNTDERSGNNEQDAKEQVEDIQDDESQRANGLPFASSQHPQFHTHRVKL